jgi:hypothetical protein
MAPARRVHPPATFRRTGPTPFENENLETIGMGEKDDVSVKPQERKCTCTETTACCEKHLREAIRAGRVGIVLKTS